MSIGFIIGWPRTTGQSQNKKSKTYKYDKGRGQAGKPDNNKNQKKMAPLFKLKSTIQRQENENNDDIAQELENERPGTSKETEAPTIECQDNEVLCQRQNNQQVATRVLKMT